MSSTPLLDDESTDTESVDPLAALRAADARPFDQRWRAALTSRLRPLTSRTALLATLLVAAAVALVGGREVLDRPEPPIEQSLPVAVARSYTTVAAPTDPATTGNANAPAVADAVVVHIAGAVRQPGLVQGRSGWRVNDAVQAAGGPLIDADLDRINLAALLTDGQRIYVPVVGEPAAPAVDGASVGEAESGPIDVNTADELALQTLPGVGPATAATIIAHRDEYGPFASVDSLVAVRGIGPATLERLRPLVTAG